MLSARVISKAKFRKKTNGWIDAKLATEVVVRIDWNSGCYKAWYSWSSITDVKLGTLGMINKVVWIDSSWRRTLCVSHWTHGSNEVILERGGIDHFLRQRQQAVRCKLKYLGHVARHQSLEHSIMLKNGTRNPCARWPKRQWTDEVSFQMSFWNFQYWGLCVTR